MKKLKAKKLLNYQPYYGFRLSAEGNKVALLIIRRHRLWEYFLAEKLQFSWDEVHPTADPHGDPIPDAQGKIKNIQKVCLTDLPLNKPATVCQVADQSPSILELLNHNQIKIGTRVEVKRKFDFDNSLEIKTKQTAPFTISEQLAKNIFLKDTTSTRRPKWRRVLSFFGPAYLVSVGYMDPGNWATDLAGGSQFGYQLIWVLLMSNLMALLLQSLSARLGIVRGRDLAQANRETYPSIINIPLYVLAEIAIAATDFYCFYNDWVCVKWKPSSLPWFLLSVCLFLLKSFWQNPILPK